MTKCLINLNLQPLPTVSELLTAELSGVTGTNREQILPCEILATNDHEAITCWLNEYKYSPMTYKSYQKEAERLLLWCMIQHKKPLSSLDRADFECYFQFLINPEPKNIWCGKSGGKGNQRGSVNWRPFVKGLSKSAQATSITIIHSLLSYLLAARYLKFNPISLMRKRLKMAQQNNQNKIKIYERILEKDEWEAILFTVNNLPVDKSHQRDEKERLIFIFSILFLLGLRINELVTHTWGAFQKIRGQWWFFVLGKGDKEGKIPVNNSLLDAVVRYRKHLQLSDLPNQADGTNVLPLVGSWNTGRAIGARHINQLLKKIAIKASYLFLEGEIFENSENTKKIEKLKHFSAHWIRHLSATSQDEQGIPLKFIKENHRHESEETTRKYVHTRDRDRHNIMQKLEIEFDND